MEPLNILVTGPFGLVGRSVVPELINYGYNVKLYEYGSERNREQAKLYVPADSSLKKNGIEIVFGNIATGENLDRALEGIDEVVHLAGVIPPQADLNPILAHKVNVNGTRNLIAAMIAQGVNRIIYSSSISIYGDRTGTPCIKSSDDPNPGDDPYANQKLEAEGLILASGLEYTILRLSYVASSDKLKIDPLMFRMPARTIIEMVHPKDVATAISNSINNPEALNNIFDIAGGENCRIFFLEYLDIMTEIFGLGAGVFNEGDFGKSYHCHKVDTGESQKILAYQTIDLKQYFKEVKEKVKKQAIPLRILAEEMPIIIDGLNLYLDISRFLFEHKAKKARNEYTLWKAQEFLRPVGIALVEKPKSNQDSAV